MDTDTLPTVVYPQFDMLDIRGSPYDSDKLMQMYLGTVRPGTETTEEEKRLVETVVPEDQLFWAAYKGDLATVDRLLADRKKGVLELNPNCLKSVFHHMDCFSPVYFAAQNGHLDVVKRMCQEEDVYINGEKSCTSITPLSWASYMGHVEVVRFFAQACAHRIDSRGGTYNADPFIAACERGHVEILEILWDVPPKYEWSGRSAKLLGVACANHQTETVRFLLTKDDVDVNSSCVDHLSPLANACRKGYLDIVQLLVQDPRVERNKDETNERMSKPLYWACASGHTEVVKYMMTLPDVELNCHLQFPMIVVAAGAGHLDLVRWLTSNPRIDVCECSYQGVTALAMASRNGHLAVVSHLLEDGRIDIHKTTEFGETALGMASKWHHLSVVELLLAQDATLEIVYVCDAEREHKYRVFWTHTFDDCRAICQLLEDYKADEKEVRRKMRNKVGISKNNAADVFALVIFVSDGLLNLGPGPCTEDSKAVRAARFFKATTNLPMGLQMIICNSLFDYCGHTVLRAHSEPAFKRLAMAHLETCTQ